jgi:AraC-like DNA-binding protein/mannose-6-phosphate isomerase-like protein (cupin superfamily)
MEGKPMRDAAVCINSQPFSVTESVLYATCSQVTNSFPPHRHDFVEIEFIIAGRGTQIINGIKYPLEKGSLCVMFPWHIHEISACEDGPLDLFKCHFPVEFLLDEKNSYSVLNGLISKSSMLSPVVLMDGAIYDKIFTLFTDIIEEYKGVQTWSEELIRTKIAEIILYFDRHRKSLQPKTGVEIKNEDAWKIIEFIHRSYNDDLTLRQVSKKFNTDVSLLNQLFKEYTGLNFDELLLEIRIRNACALLSYPHISISRIAEVVGYKSLETFHRSFMQIKGISPNKYRKTHFNLKEYN